MNGLKILSKVFNAFMWIFILFAAACLFMCFISAVSQNERIAFLIFELGVLSGISAFSTWVTKVFIDGFNHVVTAAVKYTNDNTIQTTENE